MVFLTQKLKINDDKTIKKRTKNKRNGPFW